MDVYSSQNISGLNINRSQVLDALLAERSVSRAGTARPVADARRETRRGRCAPWGRPSCSCDRAQRHGAPRARDRPAGPLGGRHSRHSTRASSARRYDPASARALNDRTRTNFVAFRAPAARAGRRPRRRPGATCGRPWQEHRVTASRARRGPDLCGLLSVVRPRTGTSPSSRPLLVVARKGHERASKMPAVAYTKLEHVLATHNPRARAANEVPCRPRALARRR